MVQNHNWAASRQALSKIKQMSGNTENSHLFHKLIGGLTAILAVVTLFSACSVNLTELPSVPFFNSNNGKITISGELTYEERAALYTGSIANLVICNDSIAADCGEVVAQQNMRVGGLSKPLPFTILVDANKILAGPEYSLRVTVTGATGRVSWITVEPFTIDTSSADPEAIEYNLGSVNMVRPDVFRNSSNRSKSSIATQN